MQANYLVNQAQLLFGIGPVCWLYDHKKYINIVMVSQCFCLLLLCFGQCKGSDTINMTGVSYK